ncbi:MAG: PTS sugar transporter subunit IIA [Candidatus Aminicenantes bacterium]|nr:PTS sugar transporter subunit IIA [Candidatus Aminicenantes bacterium]
MNICRLLNENQIFLDLESGEKTEVLGEFVRRLEKKGLIKNAKTVLKELIERENLCSTGLEKGIALPHTLTEEVEEPFLALGLIKDGMQYESLDNNPTFVLLLILGNKKDPGSQLKIIAHICRLVKETDFVERVKAIGSARDICSLLDDVEGKIG